MTLENLIITSIKTALIGAGIGVQDEWRELQSTPGLAPSFGVRIRLGTNTLSDTNGLNVIVSESIIEVFFDLQCNNTTTDWSTWIDVIILELNAFTPPTPAIGDTVQFDQLLMQTISPPEYNNPEAIGLRRLTCIAFYHFL